MRLIEVLPVSADTRIAFVGAGGKSTSMFRLAHQALAAGFERVIVTASTHLGIDQVSWADHHLVIYDLAGLSTRDWEPLTGLVLVTGPEGEDQRTRGLDYPILKQLDEIAADLDAPLLVEADGSRRLALKAPAAHEPAVPEWVNGVVVCAGASALGKPLDSDHVHRPEIFSQLSEIPLGAPVSVDGLAKVLLAAEGGLKNIPADARRVVNLAQVDSPELAGQAKRLGKRLLAGFDAVLASNLLDDGDEVKAVYRQVAGVVLAAGGSARLGRPKQLLDWHGKPFVRACAETALQSGLSPVLVVTGAYREEVIQALEGLPVKMVHNSDWAQGQGGSVRSAVEALSQP
ncbi:MAG: selenium cofactor biosynthesis protein YqeC, partial [Anaerolineales bacterium]